jgi:hypothetical protein
MKRRRIISSTDTTSSPTKKIKLWHWKSASKIYYHSINVMREFNLHRIDLWYKILLYIGSSKDVLNIMLANKYVYETMTTMYWNYSLNHTVFNVVTEDKNLHNFLTMYDTHINKLVVNLRMAKSMNPMQWKLIHKIFPYAKSVEFNCRICGKLCNRNVYMEDSGKSFDYSNIATQANSYVHPNVLCI